MTDPEPQDKKAIEALAATLLTEPELASKLLQVTASKERLNTLDMRLAALSEDMTDKQDALRRAFRDKNAKIFADVDVKKALVGFPIQHKVTINGVLSISLQPPSAKLMRSVEAMDPTAIIRPHEVALMAWVTEIDSTVMGGQKVNIVGMDLQKKLDYLRALPDLVLQRLATTCDELSTYLNVCLEIDLGN